VAESPSAVPALPGLAVAAVEWLPSGAESGLVRVRGRWIDETVREPDLPVLALLAPDGEHRFDSLPDARFSRDPGSWRGTYLVAAELVATDPEALWLEWSSGARSGLPPLTRGVEPPPVPSAPERPEEPDEPGGQVIDRAVLAERRAKRAEAAEQAQARVASEALKAVEVLELRSAELERRLEEATAERDAAGRGEALAAALASAAQLRSRSREWQLRLRTTEVARASDAVRLAVLESERATGATAMRDALASRTGELTAAREQMAAHAAELAAAGEAAAAARAEVATQRAAWERRHEELEAALARVRAELEAAREEAAELKRRTDDERATSATLTAELQRRADDERATSETLTAELERARSGADEFKARIASLEAALAAAEARLRLETVARSALEDELDRERGSFEAERAARRTAEAALAEAGETFQQRIAELERRASPETIARLAREQVAAAAVREPRADAGRLVADLDAAAAALRGRTTPLPEDEPAPAPEAEEAPADDDERPADDDEPPAPDAEPGVEWADVVEITREPCTPGVEPVRPPAEQEEHAPWTRPGFDSADADEPDEPPAPDAEPGVEWSPPDEPPPPAAVAEPSPVEPVVVSEPPPAPAVEAKPAGPVIVPAAKSPSRALMVGTDRRDYPLLRGAIVKLAHDDPATAARLLTALLPAQGAAIEGPLAYDVTIGEAGTYGIAIAGGRASVERLDGPHSRSVADFHLIGDPVMLAELLAGVDHRIGRFFGPVRARGRKRRLKQLRPLANGTIGLAEAARAGARLDPELVYRVLGYAVHPSWTRGHSFTIAQEITGDPPETWYLTARDGAGITVSSAAPEEPAATVSMSREAFDRLLREDPIPAGRRPCVKGDLEAVAQMRAWTQRARGA
jgi:hypothetical protein